MSSDNNVRLKQRSCSPVIDNEEQSENKPKILQDNSHTFVFNTFEVKFSNIKKQKWHHNKEKVYNLIGKGCSQYKIEWEQDNNWEE